MAKGSFAKPGWIRFRRASLRLGGEELIRAAEDGLPAVSSAVLSAEGFAKAEGSAEAEALAKEGYRGRQK
jgi:hypothetical protein